MHPPMGPVENFPKDYRNSQARDEACGYCDHCVMSVEIFRFAFEPFSFFALRAICFATLSFLLIPDRKPYPLREIKLYL